MNQIQLDLPVLLPEIDAQDECVMLLERWLEPMKGIERAHLVKKNGDSRLCLHFDPDVVSLGRVERLAVETGLNITRRFRHEAIPISHLNAADAADIVSDTLADLHGMLHAHVNYAAGIAYVAYDSTLLRRDSITQTLDSLAVQAVEHDHDHGSAPAFLPHWIQERWTLLLVGMAGLFFLIGWVGETFLAWPATTALLFFIASYLAGGYDIGTHALPGLLKGKFDTDILMLAAAAGAAILGEWAEGAFLLFLFSLGHAGEHYALDRARNAVNALGELMPKTARVKRAGEILEIAVEAVRIDETVIARPGDRIPVDGVVSAGESAVDQSSITGESVPVQKKVRDNVFAGSVNGSGALEIQVTALAKDNTLSRVMKMVTEAQSQQSPTQQFTERFTAIFVPTVLGLVALLALVPPLIGWMPFEDSFYRAMLLLVAASPCALAIGTPATVLAGIAQSARHGVLVKGGAYLEKLGELKVMAFDKTGTLTSGNFSVTDIFPQNGYPVDQVLRIAAAIESQSNHPLAQAVVDAAAARELALPAATAVENIAGRGVKSMVDGQSVWVGSPAMFESFSKGKDGTPVAQKIAELEAAGKTTVLVGQGRELFGILALADEPRPNISHILSQLKLAGVSKLVMLTGDNAAVAQRIGQAVGITDVYAELLPAQKLEAIRTFEADSGIVAMVGDGVNDAPALATATVGIAMGGAGTAVALETADVALMSDDLSKLPFAIALSRASRTIIRQNLGISLGVIGLLLVTSVLGIVPLSGTVILHEGSTLVVALNALRLLRFSTVEG